MCTCLHTHKPYCALRLLTGNFACTLKPASLAHMQFYVINCEKVLNFASRRTKQPDS